MKKLTSLFLFIGLLSSSVAFGQNVGYLSYDYSSSSTNTYVTRIMKTTDGGVTWGSPSTQGVVEIAGTNNNAMISFPSDNVGYLSYGYFNNSSNTYVTRIMKTIDGGVTWGSPSTRGVVDITGTNDSVTITFPSDNIGYLVYSYPSSTIPNISVTRMMKTTDGGVTWGSPTSSGGVFELLGPLGENSKIIFPSENVGYLWQSYFSSSVNSMVTRILKTTDGGITWSPPNNQEISGTENAVLSFPSNNTGYLSYKYLNTSTNTYVTRVLKTTNGGRTWSSPSTQGAVEIIGTNGHATIVFPSDNVGYLSYRYFNFSANAYATRIMKTTDGGVTWGSPSIQGTVEITGTPDNSSISFPRQTITSISQLPTLQDKISLEVFPNPTNTITNLIVEDFQDKVYSIMNIMGQEVMQGQLQSNQTTLDLTALTTKGTYLILIKEKQGGQVLAKKMITLQ